MTTDPTPDMPDFGARLHPEGAPGAAQAFLRQVLGDHEYEHNQARKAKQDEMQDAMNELHLATVRLRYQLLTVLTLGAIVAVLIGLPLLLILLAKVVF